MGMLRCWAQLLLAIMVQEIAVTVAECCVDAGWISYLSGKTASTAALDTPTWCMWKL